MITREQAKKFGFAGFNDSPHLCVVVPDGGLTISCRTTTGDLVTISFCPYKTGGPPRCIDIQHHNAPIKKVDDGRELPAQQLVVHGNGTMMFDSRKSDKPVTLTTLLLEKQS